MTGWRNVPLWARGAKLGALAVLCLTVAGCGGTSSRGSSTAATKAAAEQPLADPLHATCAQVEVAGLKHDKEFGEAVAKEYGEEDESERGAVPIGFDTVALIVCHKTKNKSLQPAEAVKDMANEIAQVSQETHTSFGASFGTLVLAKTKDNEIYGAEEVKAAQAFVSGATAVCKHAKHGIAMLLEKLAEPQSFKTPDAVALESRFRAVESRLAQLAASANLSKSAALVSFDHSAKELTGIMRHLGKLDENEEGIVQSAEYAAKIDPKQIKLQEEANAIDACGELFLPLPEPEPEITG